MFCSLKQITKKNLYLPLATFSAVFLITPLPVQAQDYSALTGCDVKINKFINFRQFQAIIDDTSIKGLGQSYKICLEKGDFRLNGRGAVFRAATGDIPHLVVNRNNLTISGEPARSMYDLRNEIDADSLSARNSKVIQVKGKGFSLASVDLKLKAPVSEIMSVTDTAAGLTINDVGFSASGQGTVALALNGSARSRLSVSSISWSDFFLNSQFGNEAFKSMYAIRSYFSDIKLIDNTKFHGSYPSNTPYVAHFGMLLYDTKIDLIDKSGSSIAFSGSIITAFGSTILEMRNSSWIRISNLLNLNSLVDKHSKVVNMLNVTAQNDSVMETLMLAPRNSIGAMTNFSVTTLNAGGAAIRPAAPSIPQCLYADLY